MEDYFSIEWGWHGDGFRMIQAHYNYYALCFLFFFFLVLFIYFWLCWVFVVVRAGGSSLILVLGLLFAVAPPVLEPRLLGHAGSVVVEQEFRCPEACGFFPGQWSNPCPLY